MATVVVLGGNFAGITSALETRRHLGTTNDRVIVVSRSAEFLFVPSLIWVPFGMREIGDITLPLAPILEHHGVEFVHAEATSVDLAAKTVSSTAGLIHYDYLVVATGPKLDWSVPGTGPHHHSACVCTPPDALAMREDLAKLLDAPGPVVVGANPRAGCVGAAYEFLLNLEHYLRRHGARAKASVTWVTPEPFLGHFGIGGMRTGEPMLKALLEHLDVRWITDAEIVSAAPGVVNLADGTQLEAAFAMLMPAFLGQDVVTASPGLGTPAGFIPVNGAYQHQVHPEVFAGGVAIDVPSPFHTLVPMGVPKTGFPADVAGKTIGRNIATLVSGRSRLRQRPFGRIPGLCVMDAGSKEVVMISNHLMRPREFSVLLPNPFYDGGKHLFERYFLWKTRHGYSYLP